jgi:dTDP-4-dehydrorhamnose 3,5-epimerase
MKISEKDILGVQVIENMVFEDHRGAFSRLFCRNELNAVIGSKEIVQINHSITRQRGIVRGLHFQRSPQAEMKIIRCVRGRVFDVVVDLRKGSNTFLHWTAHELDPKNRCAMVVPEGCAHGFQSLDEDSELIYLHTAFYTPSLEGGIRYDDPRVGIKWPLKPLDVSARDQQHPLIDEFFFGLSV